MEKIKYSEVRIKIEQAGFFDDAVFAELINQDKFKIFAKYLFGDNPISDSDGIKRYTGARKMGNKKICITGHTTNDIFFSDTEEYFLIFFSTYGAIDDSNNLHQTVTENDTVIHERNTASNLWKRFYFCYAIRKLPYVSGTSREYLGYCFYLNKGMIKSKDQAYLLVGKYIKNILGPDKIDSQKKYSINWSEQVEQRTIDEINDSIQKLYVTGRLNLGGSYVDDDGGGGDSISPVVVQIGIKDSNGNTIKQLLQYVKSKLLGNNLETLNDDTKYLIKSISESQSLSCIVQSEDGVQQELDRITFSNSEQDTMEIIGSMTKNIYVSDVEIEFTKFIQEISNFIATI